VVELSRGCAQADFDIAQARPGRELRENHGQKLLPARKPPHTMVPLITLDSSAKRVAWNEIHEQ
jgi:hypothetical protein